MLLISYLDAFANYLIRTFANYVDIRCNRAVVNLKLLFSVNIIIDLKLEFATINTSFSNHALSYPRPHKLVDTAPLRIRS